MQTDTSHFPRVGYKMLTLLNNNQCQLRHKFQSVMFSLQKDCRLHTDGAGPGPLLSNCRHCYTYSSQQYPTSFIALPPCHCRCCRNCQHPRLCIMTNGRRWFTAVCMCVFARPAPAPRACAICSCSISECSPLSAEQFTTPYCITVHAARLMRC